MNKDQAKAIVAAMLMVIQIDKEDRDDIAEQLSQVAVRLHTEWWEHEPWKE